jgi:outer membrane protein assembly factor BamA
VSSALGLEPGKPLKWTQDNFERLQYSGLFQKLMLKSVVPNEIDKTIHLNMQVMEPKDYIHFEPGFIGSFADRTIRGMLKFKHDNLLGLGYKLGCDFSYTNKTPEGMLRFENDRFGRVGGYRLSAYQRLTKNTHRSAESSAHPTFRRLRGLNAKMRLFTHTRHVGSFLSHFIDHSVGIKSEAIEGASLNSLPHVLSCLQSVTKFRLNDRLQGSNTLVTLESDTGVSGYGVNNEDTKNPSDLKQFFTTKLSSNSLLQVDDNVDLRWRGSMVKQSDFVPQQERHYPNVRGCDVSSIPTGYQSSSRDTTSGIKAWQDASVELHRPVIGKFTGLLFMDTASVATTSHKGNGLYASCGAGLIFGPVRVELARHRAKNYVNFRIC